MTRRVQELIRTFPAANTPSLQVMLLQGDYSRAETLVGAWLNDPAGAAASRDEARKLLGQIVPQLNGLQDKLHPQLQKEKEALGRMPDGAARTAYEQKVNALAGAAGRCSFLAGWGNYDLGLMEKLGGASKGQTEFEQAQKSFQLLFDVKILEEKPDAESLGLGSAPRARVALGLALAEFGCGNDKAGDAWLSLLCSPATFDDVRDQAACYQALAGKDPRHKASALDALQTFAKDYPENPNA